MQLRSTATSVGLLRRWYFRINGIKVRAELRLRSMPSRMRSFWYRFRYGIPAGVRHGSALPQLGDNSYVSVHRKGDYVDLINHGGANPGTIRLVPNHTMLGFHVECWDQNDKLNWRSHFSYIDFVAMGQLDVDSIESEGA